MKRRTTARVSGAAPSADAIRKAAFDLFARRGYLAATVREVMRACGLTQGALYNHFESKEDLLATLIRATQDDLERDCVDAVAQAGGDPERELAGFVTAFVLRHCRHRVEALVANRDFQWLDPPRLAAVIASRRRIRDMLVRILERGAAAGVFRLPTAGGKRNPRIVAMAIVNQSVYVSNWFRAGGEWDEQAVAELHVEMARRVVGIR